MIVKFKSGGATVSNFLISDKALKNGKSVPKGYDWLYWCIQTNTVIPVEKLKIVRGPII